jgi:hypothetical protein
MTRVGRWIWRKRFATAGQAALLDERLAAIATRFEQALSESSAELRGLEQATAHIRESVDDTRRGLRNLNEQLELLGHAVADSQGVVTDTRRAMSDLDGHATQMLIELYADEAGDRRRLAEVRADPEYDLAFSEDTPLVTVIIPTHLNWDSLRNRAIPSVLAQTYERLEILVVGDDAPPEAAAALKRFSDDRIRFINLPMRGPYPDDVDARWLVSGVAPYDAGLNAATGRWIAPFADDDAFRPDAIESVLDAARSECHELCYGLNEVHKRNGLRQTLGVFPPRLGQTALQGGVYHAGLRIFEQLLGAHAFGIPNDWLMLRRMLHAGVRVGFLDQIVADYFPSSREPDPQ